MASSRSRSTSHLLCHSRTTALHLSTAWRLCPTSRVCTFVAFSVLFKRLGRILNDSVPVGFLCSHDHDVHPSRVFLRAAVLTLGWRNPRPLLDCCKARPYDQLTTPATAADCRPPRDQPSALAKALMFAVRRAMIFARFLRATVVPPACIYMCP